MRFRRIAILVMAASLTAAACGDDGARSIFDSTTSGPESPVTVPTTSTPTPTTSSTTTTSTTTTSTTTTTLATTTTAFGGTLLPAASCKLPEAAFRGAIGLGFPRYADRLPTIGTVRGAVLFADFPDVPATRTTEEVFSIISPITEDFFAAVSYGRMNLELTPHHEWLRLSATSTVYGDAIYEYEPHRDHLQEAMTLADPAFDFTGFDLVVVLNTPNAANITFGPTFTGFEGFGGAVTADGEEIHNGATSGVDLLFWGGLWLPHEMGHSIGLVDLYSADGLLGFTGEFSLMNDIAALAPEYLAYERWLVGWLDDDQIACVESDATARLTPIESPGGLKALSVPLGGSRSLVVESRRALGFDGSLQRPGAIVYSIDTSIESGYGPLVILNDKQALWEGESLTVEGITFTVLESSDEGDLVAVDVGD